jgi:hypothetical protein
MIKMKSYIKLYGPPIAEALKSLRKVAVDLPEVCVMDTALEASLGLGVYRGMGGVSGAGGQPDLGSVEMVMNYFGGPDEIPEERCGSIISRSGESVGEYDFYFEWFKKPTVSQIEDLIERIDKALEPLGTMYTITSK